MAKNEDLFNQLTDQDMIKSLYVSQGVLLGIVLLLYFLYVHSVPDFFTLFKWTSQVIPLAILAAGVVLLGVYLLAKLFPPSWVEDNGENDRVIHALSLIHLPFAMAIVALIEELLFRGILQVQFGWVLSSSLFALIHFRYLKKPILFLYVLFLSLLLSWLLVKTGSLLTPILTHFLINVLQGYYVKWKEKRHDNHGCT